MRKILIAFVVFTLVLTLGACGQNADKEENSSSDSPPSQNNEPPKDVILASQLVSLEEGESILGTQLEALEIDKEMPGERLQCVYSADEIMLQVVITQDELLSGLNLEEGGAKNIFHQLVKYQKEEGPEDMFEVEGVGEEAYIIDLAQVNRWSIHILEDNYLIEIHLSGGRDKEWEWEKLKEAGKIAVEGLISVLNP